MRVGAHADAMSEQRERVAFYRTFPHQCGYLPGRQAANVVLDPELRPDQRLYEWLVSQGFRRSGHYIYRPGCPECTACVPLRVPAGEFRPDRAQRRVWRDNRDIKVIETEPRFDEEHFRLYRRYLTARHPGGGMDDPDADDYLLFLTSPGLTSRFYEFNLHGRCVALAVADVLDEALSAVYTFFEPDARRRSLGTYAILWQIEQARRSTRRWLYLGYWIRECARMSYKNRFLPHELLIDGKWRRQVREKT